MEPIQRLYKKDKIVTRSLHIDEDLYIKLQYLCDNVFDTSISKILNICVETLLQNKDNIKFYKKPYKIDSIYRSILFRKEFYDELIKIRDKTGISFTFTCQVPEDFTAGIRFPDRSPRISTMLSASAQPEARTGRSTLSSSGCRSRSAMEFAAVSSASFTSGIR